jgi:hypothetical protein
MFPLFHVCGNRSRSVSRLATRHALLPKSKSSAVWASLCTCTARSHRRDDEDSLAGAAKDRRWRPHRQDVVRRRLRKRPECSAPFAPITRASRSETRTRLRPGAHQDCGLHSRPRRLGGSGEGDRLRLSALRAGLFSRYPSGIPARRMASTTPARWAR